MTGIGRSLQSPHHNPFAIGSPCSQSPRGWGGGQREDRTTDWDENENTKEQLNIIGTSISLPVLYPKKTTLLD